MKPLLFSNVALLIGATATILLFYFFVVCSILILLVVLAFEFAILMVLLRFGMVHFLLREMQTHGILLIAFFRSFSLGKSGEFRISLRPDDAPEFFSSLAKICRQAEVPLPHQVLLQMNANAWVQMKGYRRGSGTTILGIGYDLIAGLSQAEIEAVLAHEMMHAKLVQRGFRQLLTGGVSRAARLTNALSVQVIAGRRAKRLDVLVSVFMRAADSLTRLAARLVAACSRQDEFEADRGAAQLCGAGAIRSSLLKLEDLSRIASRLQLRERITQLELGGGFGQWLVQELAAAKTTSLTEAKVEAFNKYSTHPSVRDRLAALSVFPDQTLAESPPAIGLLAHPDDVAEKLVAAIQKEVVEQEQKDSKQLDRWSRKAKVSRQLRPLQAWGIFMVIFSLIVGGLTWAIDGMTAVLAISVVSTFVTGIVMDRFGRYREKVILPVPEYALIKTAWQNKIEVKEEQIQEIEAGLRKNSADARTRKQKSALLLSQSYLALEQCDYMRAHVAARLCLELDRKSIPCTLALAVAAGGLRHGQQVGQAVHFVRGSTGMKGESPAWGAGWALLLVGDWGRAEAFLEQARIKKPTSPTVLALLAISQVRRGKLFTAIASARKACALRPNNKEHAKLLIDLLLQGGFLREAGEQLQQLVSQAMIDTELMFAMVKLNLLYRNVATAEQWMELVRQSSAGPHKFITLGETCIEARHNEKAVEHFQQALVNGHYPEALLGLGRLEADRQNRDLARTYLLAALDLHRPLGENSMGPISLIAPILQQLKLLQDPIANCRAWIAALPGNLKPVSLAGASFLVYAPTNEEAKKSLDIILAAMQPGIPPPTIKWKPAPKERQPDGPAYPGIQALLDS